MPNRTLILEGLLTTSSPDGAPHLAPMGPLVDPGLTRFTLRPFQSSTTFANLARHGAAVFHVTDDVELLARAAVGGLRELPPLAPCEALPTVARLADACRWYALRVVTIDDREPRSRIETQLVGRGTLREFFGFNRAKHAVLEAAIAVTRLEILPPDEILAELARARVPVEKTGGPAEHRALKFLEQVVRDALACAAPVAD
jgi:hypothetical protein